MAILIAIAVIALVVYLGFWIVDRIGLPHPVNMIAKAIIGIIGIMALLSQTGVLSSSGL